MLTLCFSDAPLGQMTLPTCHLARYLAALNSVSMCRRHLIGVSDWSIIALLATLLRLPMSSDPSKLG